MDSDSYSSGLLIVALTMGSVGLFLIGLVTAQTDITATLVLMITVIGLASFFIWKRGDYPRYFICSWTIPLVAVVVLLFNILSPDRQIRLLGMLFTAAGVANLLMWGFFNQVENE